MDEFRWYDLTLSHLIKKNTSQHVKPCGRKNSAQMRGDTTGQAEYSKGIGLFKQFKNFQIKIIIIFFHINSCICTRAQHFIKWD